MKNLILIYALILLIPVAALAQSTAFTFQGRLNDGSAAASGNVQLEVRLYDALTGGTQIGSTVNIANVPLINGVFSTELDFGAPAFDGSPRFLEIGVRPAGSSNPYTVLGPRHHLSSVPYSIKSGTSVSADSLSAVCSGCIQDANISNVSGSKVTGEIPAQSVPTGSGNYIQNADTAGGAGRNAVQQAAGFNISGNGIVGGNLGIGTTNPQSRLDVNGTAQITTGGSGGQVIFAAPNGESGMLIKGTSRADIRFDGSTLKLLAGVSTGAPLSTNGISINTSGSVGIGTTNPGARLDVAGNMHVSSTLGVDGRGFFNNGLSVLGGDLFVAGQTNLNDTLVGVVARFTNVSLFPVSGGDQSICRNSATGFLASCSSSLRYKSKIENFGEGLNFLNRLRPIRFNWKQTGQPDIGFGAEDVAKINPLFVTYNDRGKVEGVKYDRLSVVFVNAFKEQQTQIEQLRVQIESLKKLVCLKQSITAVCQEK